MNYLTAVKTQLAHKIYFCVINKHFFLTIKLSDHERKPENRF